MANAQDRQLIEYVRSHIMLGHTHIRIPSSLMQGASDLAMQDVEELSRVNGVKVTIVAGE